MAGRRRAFLLLFLPAVLAVARASEDDTGTCAALGDDGACLPPVTEDPLAEEVKKLCPLTHAPRSRALIERAFRLLPTLKPVLRALSLWPAEVETEAWSDDYVFSAYVIVARVLLGIYTTRNKDYVRVPTQMLDIKDVIQLEQVHSPHTDVDGAPNFYWMEFLVPQSVLDWMFVPMYTCFYGAMRKLAMNITGGPYRLTGDFDDALNDTRVNTWEAVLRPGQGMKDWVMSFYEHAHAWDGVPLWPKQMTDFSVYFRKDEWADQVEYAMAFHLIGTHRLESGAWTFKNGFEGVTLPYRLPLNSFSSIPVRPGLGRFGVDMYFNADGLPVLLETPDKEIIARGDPRWQYWKFVWRSTLVTGITLVDHLHMSHYRAGTVLARAMRVGLRPDHPLRRMYSIFSFGSIFINAQAMHVLLGPNHLLHRATPFKDFPSLSAVVPESMEDVTMVPAIMALMNETEWDKLDPKLQATPFYADGKLLMGVFKKMVARLVDATWSLICQEDGKMPPDYQVFVTDMYKITMDGHYKIEPGLAEQAPQYSAGKGDCSRMKPIMVRRLLAYIYTVTAWHRQVGFVGDYYADPSLSTMSWKDGEAFGRPKQHMIMSVINVFTSTRQPMLKEDYTHLFKGMQPDLEAEFTQLWRDFQRDLQDVESEINRRNQNREIYNINHSPEVLECSVSK